MLLSSLAQAEVARLQVVSRALPFPDPIRWTSEFLDLRGGQLTSYQVGAIGELRLHHRVCWRALRGAGKTATAAITVLMFVWWCENDKVDWKVITTASDWRQVTHYLWPEIHKWARRVRKDRWNFDWNNRLTAQTIKGDFGEAFGTVAGQADRIEGAHASRMLFLYDEAKIIPDETWDAIEGSYSTGDCYAFAVSTPGPPAGRFYEIQSGKVGAGVWKVIRVTLEQAVAAGRVTQQWVDDCGKLWSKTSAKYRRDVLGEFAEDETDALIPLAWVEAAMERHNQMLEEEADNPGVWGPLSCVSCDPAYTGSDKTAIAFRHGWNIRSIESHIGLRTTETAGMLRNYVNGSGVYAIVDGIGVGAGVVDTLMENNVETIPFIAGARAPNVANPDLEPSFQRRYANLRAAAWWRMRELLDPSSDVLIALPDDDELKGDLTTPKRGATATGAEIVEAKEKVRERLGRSTDKGDAVVMSFWHTDQFAGWETFMAGVLAPAKAQQ